MTVPRAEFPQEVRVGLRPTKMFTLPKWLHVLALAVTWLSIADVVRAEEPIPGIGPVSPFEKVASQLNFTEGPAYVPDRGLFFSDVPASRIHRLDLDGKVSVAWEPSGHANGLMCDGSGKLIVCEMDGALVALDLRSEARTVLTDRFEGKRYNAPNDLVIESSGGVYFTDPRFRAPTPWPQGKEGVYYRSAQGEVRRLIDDLPAPNGIILSPDERTLYVIPSLQREMMAYSLEGPGVLREGRVFCRLKQPANGGSSGGDGLTIDRQGNLYITSQLGIQVFDPKGRALGIIQVPEQPANVTFGGSEGTTLFVTARTSVYQAPMAIPGHVFPGTVPLP